MSHDARPPQNLEAERSVLGSMMLDKAACHEAMTVLKAEDFYRDSHGIIFTCIRSMIDRDAPVDLVTLSEELETLGKLGGIGGRPYLAECLECTPHAANAGYHAEIVRQKAVTRQLILASDETRSECYRGNHPASDLIRMAEERIFALDEAGASGSTRPIGPFAEAAMDRLQRRTDGEYGGVATGFADLDDLIDGMANGSLIIVAARPSMGKTALGLNISENASLDGGIPALFVSLEMSGVELAERILVSRSRVDGFRVRTGQGLESSEMTALGKAFSEIRSCSRLMIDDTPIRSASQIAANARRHRARHGIGLVVIDYIQLIDGGSDVAKRSSRQEQVAAISRRLKCLAKELDVPVLALSQLNRQSENRDDRRPRLADLRESGALEQDADMVLLLHRSEVYDPRDNPGLAEVIVAKNRNGATGTVNLTFLKNLARFEDYYPNANVHAAEGERPDF